MSLLNLLFVFPAPIVLAMVFNEAPFKRWKRVVQTASYLPHFLSYVVVASLWRMLLDRAGLVNTALMGLHLIRQPVEFWTTAQYYWPLSVLVNLWQGIGWGAIIYLAAIANVNEEIYEAAIIDGAGRFRRIMSIMLPAISKTIVVMLILQISGLFRSNFDQSYLLGNPFNRDRSYVLEYYVLDMGLSMMRYSFATAANLVQSVVSLILLLATNAVANRVNQSGIL
jgi:putative aldouronate transport system permease protein